VAETLGATFEAVAAGAEPAMPSARFDLPAAS
jgi:hypothetical protein